MSKYMNYQWLCEECQDIFKPYGEIDYISRTDEALCPNCGATLIRIGCMDDNEIDKLLGV